MPYPIKQNTPATIQTPAPADFSTFVVTCKVMYCPTQPTKMDFFAKLSSNWLAELSRAELALLLLFTTTTPNHHPTQPGKYPDTTCNPLRTEIWQAT